jgi:hypothetical protein
MSIQKFQVKYFFGAALRRRFYIGKLQKMGFLYLDSIIYFQMAFL